jgi:hypothetical protein
MKHAAQTMPALPFMWYRISAIFGVHAGNMKFLHRTKNE